MLTEFFKYLMMMMVTMTTKTLVVLLNIMSHVNHVHKSAQPFHTDVTNQMFMEFSHVITLAKCNADARRKKASSYYDDSTMFIP